MIDYENWLKIPALNVDDVEPQSGVGLSLSGGGFKAALYHLGAIIRLNELGLLKRVEVISSVSGGAIIGAWLGLVWDELEFDDETGNILPESLRDKFILPIYELITQHTLGDTAFLRGLLPFKSRGQELSAGYAKHLYSKANLSDITSATSAPRFIFTATCARTNRAWRFSREAAYCDYIGNILSPDFKISDIVAASSAFPLLLDPLTLDLSGAIWDTEVTPPFHVSPYKDKAILRDGGLIDNLGLDPLISTCHTILVSDAGSQFSLQESPKCVRLSFRRTIAALGEHGETSRVTRLYEMAKRKERDVLFWRLRQNPEHFEHCTLMHLPPEDAYKVITAPMNLNRYYVSDAKMIINHGYAMCGLVFENYGQKINAEIAPSNIPFS